VIVEQFCFGARTGQKGGGLSAWIDHGDGACSYVILMLFSCYSHRLGLRLHLELFSNESWSGTCMDEAHIPSCER
jgi:hypothetical protein